MVDYSSDTVVKSFIINFNHIGVGHLKNHSKEC